VVGGVVGINKMAKKQPTKKELEEEILYAQDMEMEWFEEGNRLKALYNKRFKEEL
jgi:hypothetical protein